MSDITSIDGKSYFGITTPAAKSEMDMTTFLRLLTTQLANQNPLEPMNDRDFFAQMAQLGTVQGIDKMNSALETTQANALIGKIVTAIRPTSDGSGESGYVTGIATQLSIRNGKTVLGIQEPNGGVVEVGLAAIQQVADPSSSGDSVQTMVGIANSANLIGKTLTAPHPTLKDAKGQAETLTGEVKKVTFEGSNVYLTVADRLGHDVRVRLQDVTGFSK